MCILTYFSILVRFRNNKLIVQMDPLAIEVEAEGEVKHRLAEGKGKVEHRLSEGEGKMEHRWAEGVGGAETEHRLAEGEAEGEEECITPVT